MDTQEFDSIPQARRLLSGLIRQRHELGSLGTTLVLLLLDAGVRPAYRSPGQTRYHRRPDARQ